MRLILSTLALLLLTFSFVSAQESLEDYYQTGKANGTLDLRPEVDILRVNLSQEGEELANSLEEQYVVATSDIPQVTRDGFLSNGVGKYLAKKELLEKIDVYQIEENSNYRHSNNYDFSEFFSNIDNHLAEAQQRAKQSLFFIINEDCRVIGEKIEKYGNLECWASNLELYQQKMDLIDELKKDLN